MQVKQSLQKHKRKCPKKKRGMEKKARLAGMRGLKAGIKNPGIRIKASNAIPAKAYEEVFA